MAQFGAATIITDQVKLILLDCFETLVELDETGYRPRKGVMAFIDHFLAKGLALVVISDAQQEEVTAALVHAGIASRISRIYHAGNALTRLADGRVRKRLDLPLIDFGLKPSQAVFIGDSPLDGEAAHLFHLPFIRIPRSEDRSFTFAVLIGGPSRYNSAEFSATFFEHYLADQSSASQRPIPSVDHLPGKRPRSPDDGAAGPDPTAPGRRPR